MDMVVSFFATMLAGSAVFPLILLTDDKNYGFFALIVLGVIAVVGTGIILWIVYGDDLRQKKAFPRE